MKRIDWGVVLGVFGAFAVLVLLFTFHPFSCVSAKSASRAGGPAPASGSLDLQSEFDSAVASGPVATGAYDSTAASECRYSCAAKIPYEDSELVSQPGVHDGQLTRCPVSGVVFAVDAKRPRVTIGAHGYVTCCEGCATKLRKAPGKFLRI